MKRLKNENGKTYGWNCHSTTVNGLLRKVTQSALYEPNPNILDSDGANFMNVTLSADKCQYDLDIGKRCWLTGGRWTKLVKEYVKRNNVEKFIHQAQEIYKGREPAGGTTVMPFELPQQSATRKWWGGCLGTLEFYSDKGQSCIVLKSRTTYWGHMGAIDPLIAERVAHRITGGRPDLVGFVWHITGMQMNIIRSIPYLISDDKFRAQIEHRIRRAKDPTAFIDKFLEVYNRRIVEPYAEKGVEFPNDEKYQIFKQIQKKWVDFKNEPDKIRSVDQSKLDFDQCDY
jgi:hypothetical protein